ncbi:MAG: hypothetical protein KTR30_33240 [Saprospiraceae bacterium]|nr:hypothetical protein [Saprospiraceae bacterium]
MLRIKIFTILLLFGSSPLLLSQKPADTQSEYEAAYKKRIQKPYLNNVYIPADMAEAFAEFNRLIDKDSKNKFKSVPEDIAAKKLHFSFGRWMTVNWSFYEGSRFSHYLKQVGVTHPDDMARFVIISYHRYLNKKPLGIKEQVVFYQERRKAEIEARRAQGTVIHTETRQLQPKGSGN